MMYALSQLRWRCAQYLEQRWWRRYLGRKDPQRYLREKRRYWEQLLDQLAAWPSTDAAVLDAGCGPAGIFTALHERNQVTALDPLLDRYAAWSLLHPQHYPTVRFVRASLEEADLAHDFEWIYCLNAINHVRDWQLSLDRLSEWAGSETRLLLTSDVHRHSYLWRLFRWLPGDLLHPQQHLPHHYRTALSQRGWLIEREVELRRERIFSYRAWVCVRAPD